MALAAGMPGSHARIEIQWEILTQLPVCHSFFTKPRAKIAKGQQKMWQPSRTVWFGEIHEKSVGKRLSEQDEPCGKWPGWPRDSSWHFCPPILSPFLDSKRKHTAPCHHSVGIRIIKHGIICPQTSPCLFSQPDGSHKPNANESLPADFVKLEAQQVNKPASVSSLCWSHTDTSPTGACLCQQLRHLDIYLRGEHFPFPFSCSGPYSYTRNFRLKLAKFLRESKHKNMGKN